MSDCYDKKCPKCGDVFVKCSCGKTPADRTIKEVCPVCKGEKASNIPMFPKQED